MDFISIASEQHRFLRFLDEMLGNDDTTTTDSVSNMNNNHNIHTPNRISSSYEDSTSTFSLIQNNIQEESLHTRPIFSKNAEGELFLLATNFLLYVALVIVVILVCRIYFPELLMARTHNTSSTSTSSHHKNQKNKSSSNTESSSSSSHVQYRVADPLQQPLPSASTENDDDDDDDIHYGTDDDDDMVEPEDALFHDHHHHHHHHDSKHPPKFSLEFQQESLSRKQVLQRLIFCCIMLNVTFVLWGALQVRYIFMLVVT